MTASTPRRKPHSPPANWGITAADFWRVWLKCDSQRTTTLVSFLRGTIEMPKPTILTPAAIARIPHLVRQGLSAAEIASQVGCTLGTLRVRCSRLGISLRRRGISPQEKPVRSCQSVHPAPVRVGCPRPRHSAGAAEGRVELKVLVPQITAEQLRQRAALRGISGATLAAELLITIGRDSLYNAVLDENL
jgi:hypothetical protein